MKSDVSSLGFDRDDAVLLAVHSATIRKGKGLRTAVRRTKKKIVSYDFVFSLILFCPLAVSIDGNEVIRCFAAIKMVVDALLIDVHLFQNAW